jgi:hypothetical protein
LAVLDRGAKQLLLFGSDGTLRRASGRPGDGPGEFGDPIQLVRLAADSVAIWDWELNRITVLAPDGTVAETTPLNPPVANPTGDIGTMSQTGTWVVGQHDVKWRENSFEPQSLVLLAYDRGGTLLDTILKLPYGELGLAVPEARMMGSPVFDSRGSFAASAGRLYTSDGAHREVRVRSVEGLGSIIRWSGESLEVKSADVELYWSKRMQAAPGLHSLLRKQRDVVPVADSFPAVGQVLAGQDGSVWIREFVRPGSTVQRWLGFTSRGEPLCQLSLPATETILEFGRGYVVAVVRGPLDVEEVVVRTVEVARPIH